MREFKTAEELQRAKLEESGLVPFRMPVDKIILIYARQSTRRQALKNKESALQQTKGQLARALELSWSEERRLLSIENQAKGGRIKNASGRLCINEREGLSAVIRYIETLLKTYGREIEVINQAENSTENLLSDLTNIMYSFCTRFYGQRRAKRQAEKIVQELEAEQDATG